MLHYGLLWQFQGKEIVSEWIAYFPKAIPEAKPEIIRMLGDRGDESALPLITSSLSDSDQKVRSEAAAALAGSAGKSCSIID